MGERIMKVIAIAAAGPSQYLCPKVIEDGEKWCINSQYQNHENVDRVFLLHDLLTEILIQDHSVIGKLNDLGVPVYTAGPAPVFENNIPYPVEKVVAEFQVGFFLNTMAYMLAFAIMQKPEEIHLYGVDMRPDSGYEWHKEEKGCLEFWLGVAIGRGIKINIPPESYLLKRTMVSNWYAFKPIKESEGVIKFVNRSDRGKNSHYIVTACDANAKPIGESIMITPKGPMPVVGGGIANADQT
jgi:hypothetical protein